MQENGLNDVFLTVHKDNRPATTLYAKRGYGEYGDCTEAQDEGGSPANRMILHKPLRAI